MSIIDKFNDVKGCRLFFSIFFFVDSVRLNCTACLKRFQSNERQKDMRVQRLKMIPWYASNVCVAVPVIARYQSMVHSVQKQEQVTIRVQKFLTQSDLS